MRIAVLISGGLDSAVLSARLKSEGKAMAPIYVAQGLAWEKAERHAVRRFLRAIGAPPPMIFKLPMEDVYGRHWSRGHGKVPGAQSKDAAVYLPGRNLLLTIKAAVFCAMHGIRDMVIGSLDHNPFPDATPAFYRLWSRALSKGLGKPVRVMAPFRSLEKAVLVRRYARFPLHLSFSCIAPRGFLHCGRCNKCAERQKAFREAGVKDQTRYHRNDRKMGGDGAKR